MYMMERVKKEVCPHKDAKQMLCARVVRESRSLQWCKLKERHLLMDFFDRRSVKKETCEMKKGT